MTEQSYFFSAITESGSDAERSTIQGPDFAPEKPLPAFALADLLNADAASEIAQGFQQAMGLKLALWDPALAEPASSESAKLKAAAEEVTCTHLSQAAQSVVESSLKAGAPVVLSCDQCDHLLGSLSLTVGKKDLAFWLVGGQAKTEESMQQCLQLLSTVTQKQLQLELDKICLAVDLKQRRSTEQERVNLSTAITQTAEAICITDTDQRIQYLNAAFEKITGYGKQQALGQPLATVLSSGETEVLDQYESLQAAGVWHGRVQSTRKDGASYERETTVSPVKNEEGDIVNYVSVSRDVSREVFLESRLREAQKMQAIGTLANGIAHDFNNVLYAILGFTELAMADLTEGSLPHANLSEVVKATKRAADVVKQILAFSSGDDQERRPIQLQPVLKGAIKLLRETLPSTIQISPNIATECAPIFGNPTQLHQVVVDLCANAYQAMRRKGGLLEIELSEETVTSDYINRYPELSPGPHVLLAISDTGEGMDAITLTRIFEPYFTTKSLGQGSGMGLALVHRIVRSHAGVISVESELGYGTRFTMLFPAAGVEKRIEGVPPDQDSVLSRSRVLFIDDEEMLVRMVTTGLGRMGYQVEPYASSVEALAVFRDQPHAYDVVITDQTMPKMTGSQLAEEIKKVRPDIPVILTSGYQTNTEDFAAVAIAECVQKPIGLRALAEIIERVLSAKG